MSRYAWSRLNNLQKGSFGEHFAKMEFAMYGFLVFSSEVDDRGIDFVARNERGKHFDVQVKTITGWNYTYVTESRFSDSLLVCLVVLEEGLSPNVFLFTKSDWLADTQGLLQPHRFPNAKEPEYGIHVSKAREEVLRRYCFETVITKYVEF